MIRPLAARLRMASRHRVVTLFNVHYHLITHIDDNERERGRLATITTHLLIVTSRVVQIAMGRRSD